MTQESDAELAAHAKLFEVSDEEAARYRAHTKFDDAPEPATLDDAVNALLLIRDELMNVHGALTRIAVILAERE